MRQLKIIKQVTDKENTSLDKYLHDISKTEMITAEEEVDLAQRIHNGDLNARNRLINANLRFVVSVSKQYQNKGNIIRLYFGLNGKQAYTLEEIGEKYNLTRERVRQIKEKAIRRLKPPMRSRVLKTYLG